ncbi:hypothetical protein [Planomonospora venezuelensis]|uniref:Secreted protein n=1 Tax=Planomonospora venezuelensis TaxID=1999 RepID=A0A841DIB5_PLAVE|nr:hypothetical protein [Planomonospora venezuelensis]MBB5966906.1 hypothetical protein [Planomonospora venezuelensis]GIN02407.1 hypothetical protein Pve01_40650 [Planomonospora venezuelensis]
MRQKLGFIAGWFGATVLAISIAWFGVRDVLHLGVFDDVTIERFGAANGRTGAAPPLSGPTAEPVVAVGTPTATSGTERPDRTADPSPAAARSKPARPGPQNTGHSVRPRGSASPSPSSARPSPARTTAAPKPAQTSAAPKPAATTSAPKAAATTSAPKPAATTTAPKATTQAAAANQNVRVVRVKGGTVSFTIENGACRLVSAVPNSGYQTRISQADGWIRVDLYQGDHGSAAFCIGHENRTDTWEY